MSAERTITSCEHFDEIRFKPEDQFTDADFQFMAEHIDSCPLGIHTEEALDRFLNMSPEEIESKILADIPPIDPRNVSKPSFRPLWVTRTSDGGGGSELVIPTRRSFIRGFFAAAVTAPALGVAGPLQPSEKEGWISRKLLDEFHNFYGDAHVQPNRLEMLGHLLKGTGSTKYAAARNHPHLPPAGPDGYARDRRAIEAFMQLESKLPGPRSVTGEEVTIGPGDDLVIAGSPRSNDEAKLYLPFRDLTQDDDGLISNTFRPELVPYHFVIGKGKVWSQTIAADQVQTLSEPTFAIAGRGNRLWQPRQAVAQGRLQTDFLLLSRLPHSPTGGDIIIIAGGHGAGTEAFRLLFDETAFPISRFLDMFRILEGKRYFQVVFECHDISHGEDGSQAHRLVIPEDCPPAVIEQPMKLFKKS